MKTISYVIPIYNAERYLSECIESILAQKSDDIELILVDDGSCDSSPAICDDYGARDSRVSVIHKKNGGVSSARNAGLAAASGEYIRFIDADDKICENEEPPLTEQNGADLITAGAVVLDGNGSVLREVKSELLGEFEACEILSLMNGKLKRTTLHYVWNHFYKREIIEREGLQFDTEVSLGEDFLFNASYFKCCKRVSYIPENICRYYKRDNGSLSGRFKDGELDRRRKMDSAFLSLFEECGLAEIKRSEINRMIGEIAYASLLKVRYRFPKGIYRKKLRFIQDMLSSEYYELISAYLSSEECTSSSKKIEKALIGAKMKRSFFVFCKIKYALK